MELSKEEKIAVIDDILGMFKGRDRGEVEKKLNERGYYSDVHLCDIIPETYNQIFAPLNKVKHGKGNELIPELEDERPMHVDPEDTTEPWWDEEDIEARVNALENMKEKIKRS